jgi:hypothetical protein
MAILAVANSSISSVQLGAIGGGAGFTDSFYVPLILGWHLKRADIQAGYGFVAPTGRFVPGATNNVGSGYWANCPLAGETFYLTKNKGTQLSAFQFYEFHTEQRDTEVHPGQTMSLDYSLTQVLPLEKNMKTLLQAGLIGYGQWQTTNKTGPRPIDDIQGRLHYGVLGLGAGANVILPERKVSLGFKYYKEFHATSTVEGYSLQIFAGISF